MEELWQDRGVSVDHVPVYNRRLSPKVETHRESR
jgi:hypothetical protein